MWSVVRAFLKALPKYKFSAFCYTFLSIILIALGVWQPYVYKQAIDGLVNILSIDNSGQANILMWVILWLVINYFSNILDSIKDWIFWQKLANPIYIDYLYRAYNDILHFQYHFFVEQKAGELMKVLDDGVDAFSSLTMIVFQQLLIPILSFIALLIFAWFQSRELTIACLVIVPIQALWGYITYKKAAPYTKLSREKWHELFGYISDVLSNILTTKSFHQEKKELTKMHKLSDESLLYARRSNTLWLLFDFFDINTFSQGTIIVTGFFLIKNGQTSVGTLLMFLTILNQLLSPVRLIKSNIRGIQNFSVQYEKLQKILQNAPLIKVPENGHKQTDILGAIELKDISFAYNPTRQILNDISLKIAPGEKVAFVGHSGAGKSTMALLIMRFYDVIKGSITLDGVDLRDWDYDNLRTHFGVVWQENMLFHDSIENNIRYSAPEASEKDVQEASKQAFAHDYISKLSQGYSSIVGDRGIRLSGGEKQRVAIARALLKNPRIVILDEATSALDSITEREVQKGILNLIKDRTAIIIAHRLSTVQHCDKIVVMDKGNILAVGKHAELLKTCKQYQEMVSLQANGFFPA